MYVLCVGVSEGDLCTVWVKVMCVLTVWVKVMCELCG